MGGKYAGASIIPSGTHIIYDRPSNNEYWERRRISAMQGISYPGIGGSIDLGVIGANLKNMAVAERQKELQFLDRAGFKVTNEADLRMFIENFNSVLQGSKHYREALNRLKFSLRDDIRNRTETRAANITSYFLSTFETILINKINSYVNSNINSFIHLSFQAWTPIFDRLAREAIEESFQARFGKIQASTGKQAYKNNLYGTEEEYADIAAAYDQIAGMNKSFEKMLSQKLKGNLENLKQSLYESIRKNKNTKNVSSSVRNKLETRASSIGGSVYEYLQAICQNLSIPAGASANIQVVSGEKVKTDIIGVYNFKAEIDASKLSSILNEELSSVSNLFDASKKIDNLLAEEAFNLDTNFIVYTSAKMYNLGRGFKSRGGFNAIDSVPISNMLNLLQNAGVKMNIGNMNDFLVGIYNAMTGAILQSERGKIKEDISRLVAQGIAKLLFDDWTQIGAEQTSGAKSIHAFALNGINVPYSYFLSTLGEALSAEGLNSFSDVSDIAKVSVSFGQIQDKTEGMRGPDDVVKPRIYAAWNEQRKKAENQVKVSVRILANFESLLAQL